MAWPHVFSTLSQGNFPASYFDDNFNAAGTVPQGGTGAATLPLDNVLLGNGTGAVQAVPPGANGNVLASNGTTWVSQANSGAISVSVRQTVLSGPVDANGLPNFGGATGATTVTTVGTLIATAANGFGTSGSVDIVGSGTNLAWTGLSTNGTMYLYATIAGGVLTPVSTALAPIYQWGGTPSITSGQLTFNIQTMTGYLGNGASAPQTNWVAVGEVTVAAGVVSAIIWYALMGRYDSGLVATLPGASSAVSVNHNIGIKTQLKIVPYIECISIDDGYAIGDRLTNWTTANGAYDDSQPVWWTANSCGYGTNASFSFRAVPKAGGTGATNLTLANWKYGFNAKRDF